MSAEQSRARARAINDALFYIDYIDPADLRDGMLEALKAQCRELAMLCQDEQDRRTADCEDQQ